MSKSSDMVKKWRQSVKTIVVECLGGCCQICGYKRCKNALELHHINPDEKDFGFGSIMSPCRSWKVIYQEAKKCILLCSNCHREVHHGVTKMPKKWVRFDETKADGMRSKSSLVGASSRDGRSKGSKTTSESSMEKARTLASAKREKVANSRKSLQLEAIASRVLVIKKSGVDFSSFGWATKIASLIGVSPQKVTPWMKIHMADFYKTKCFVRSSSSK